MSETREDLFAFYSKYAKVQAALTAALGGGTLLGTTLVMDLFGMEKTAASVLAMRAFGASLLGVSAMHYFTKDTREVGTVRAVGITNMVEDGLLGALTIPAILGGTFNRRAWILTAAFGAEVAAAIWLVSKTRGE